MAIPISVLTDRPELFKNAFRHKEDFTHIWQQKRHIIRRTLESFNQAIFIDSDFVLKNKILEPVICNSIEAYVVGGIENYTSFHKTTAWPILDKLGSYMGIDWRQAKWVSPMTFGVLKDDKTDAFLNAWDRIAVWLRDNGAHIFNDGNTIGLACLAANIEPKESKALIDLYTGFKHLEIGDWRHKDILA